MFEIKYLTSLILFYMKGIIQVDKNFFKIQIPNSILMIPLGCQKRNVPIPQLASVSSNFELKFKDLIIGFILVVLGIAITDSNFIIGPIFIIFGANQMINSFSTDLTVITTGGEDITISFLFFEKSKAYKVENMITSLITERHIDTNVRVATEKSTEAIVNALKK